MRMASCYIHESESGTVEELGLDLYSNLEKWQVC